MVNLENTNKLKEILKQFPLKKGKEIKNNSKLFEIINIYGSLVTERVKSKILDHFPNANLESLNSESDLNDINNMIIKEYDNETSKLFNNEKVDETNSKFNNFGIGIDIENLDYLSNEIFEISNYKLRESLFTNTEFLYSLSRPNPLQTLTGIYSAKESVKKVLNFKINKYNEIEINHLQSRKPFVKIKNEIYENLIISISHVENFVLSICFSFPKT